MRNAWIHQGYTARYINNAAPSTTNVKAEQHFWGIGPLAGLGSEWHIDKQWWFFGNFSGSILAGDYDISGGETADPIASLSANTTRMAPNLQGSLGFGWQTNFNRNTNHVALTLAYETQYWWKQNLLVAYGSDENLIYRGGDDLGLQGFTLNLLLDF